MSEGDRQVNRELAAKLFQNVMGGKPGRTLDIGAKLPVFAAALQQLGCEAWALEHEPINHDLPVQGIPEDFESWRFAAHPDDETWWTDYGKFDFISCIHFFEHVYDPVAAVRKFRCLVSDDGALFIRMPDHSVRGIERDMTTDHFLIHPFVHSISSVLQCFVETQTFVIVDSWILDGYGQRDMVCKPV